MEAEVCHSESPLVHMSALANVHYSGSWVCFEASGFCDTVNTGSSLNLLLGILLLSCVVGPAGRQLQQLMDGVDVEANQLIILNLDLSGS